MGQYKKISIIILNYNGSRDTIEVLTSISALKYPLFNVILIDNGSIDQSVEEITVWVQKRFIVDIYHRDVLDPSVKKFASAIENNPSGTIPKLSIIKNSDNVGFAAGCNQGIQFALLNSAEYVWLLNNDTIVEPDSLSVLVAYLDNDSTCQIATPQIRLYDEPDRIWNCGGQLKWYGARQYYFVHRPVNELPEKEAIDITFVTGCAPLIRSTLLENLGGFTEKFFFGEEDFEFSLRMKRAHAKMVCCLQSIIYHKVGASIDKTSDGYNIGKAYVHYLNRFINIRTYMPRFLWHGWRILYVGYIFFFLGKQSEYSVFFRLRFIKKLLKDSFVMEGVDKKTFLMILNSNVDYFQKL
jgi:GT2 family glycosyltransferase